MEALEREKYMSEVRAALLEQELKRYAGTLIGDALKEQEKKMDETRKYTNNEKLEFILEFMKRRAKFFSMRQEMADLEAEMTRLRKETNQAHDAMSEAEKQIMIACVPDIKSPHGDYSYYYLPNKTVARVGRVIGVEIIGEHGIDLTSEPKKRGRKPGVKYGPYKGKKRGQPRKNPD